MNIQGEFEMFHYHLSSSVNRCFRFLLAVTGWLLQMTLRLVNHLHDQCTEPMKPEVNYQIHVQ